MLTLLAAGVAAASGLSVVAVMRWAVTTAPSRSAIGRIAVRRLTMVILAGGAVVAVLAMLTSHAPGVVRFDQRVAESVVAHRSQWATPGLRAVTRLGSSAVIVGVAVAMAIAQTRRLRSSSAWRVMLVAVVGQFVSAQLIKATLDRARPNLGQLVTVADASFPSGHSAAAAATFGTAAWLIGRGRSASARSIAAGLAVSVAIAVAASRVLLGVHWLTDVVAGLALGWTWCAAAARLDIKLWSGAGNAYSRSEF